MFRLGSILPTNAARIVNFLNCTSSFSLVKIAELNIKKKILGYLLVAVSQVNFLFESQSHDGGFFNEELADRLPLTLESATEALRPQIEKLVSDSASLDELKAVTDNGRVYHGTNLTSAINIITSNIMPTTAASDVNGLYTISSYSRAMEYAYNHRLRVPVVLEFSVDFELKPRVLVLNKTINDSPEFVFLKKHFGGSRNKVWAYLAEKFSLDATVDYVYPVFFSKRVLKGPQNPNELVESLKQRLQSPELHASKGFQTLSSHELARSVLNVLSNGSCHSDLKEILGKTIK